jgi:hypothetical protein
MQSGGLLARRKMNQPPYVVLVGGADDLEDLRNMAYAAAVRPSTGTKSDLRGPLFIL